MKADSKILADFFPMKPDRKAFADFVLALISHVGARDTIRLLYATANVIELHTAGGQVDDHGGAQ